MSPADLTAAVAGLRTCPPGVTGEAKAEWEASEPAWRLLHAVTLHEIYRARCRTHAAYHASPQTSPKAASTRHVVRRIKLRLQQRIEYEHEKAKYARQHSHEGGPMAAFQRHWVTPGAAVFTKQGPRVALLSPPQNKEPPLRGGVHLRTVAIFEPAKGKRGTSAVREPACWPGPYPKDDLQSPGELEVMINCQAIALNQRNENHEPTNVNHMSLRVTTGET